MNEFLKRLREQAEVARKQVELDKRRGKIIVAPGSHLKVWADSPPMCQVFVTPHVASNGAAYHGHDSPLVKIGQIEAGIHVALAEHKAELDSLNA